jgi:D-glycero-D-manno-heptose 1,7-bisphosphate phosphatase
MSKLTEMGAIPFPDTRYRVTKSDGILSFNLVGIPSKTPQGTVFLDRDGVLNQRIPGSYVTRWADFVFLPGVIGALAKLKVAGFQLVIVSNQAGVAKGIFTCADLIQITEALLSELRTAGVVVDGAFFCLHAPSDVCSCRKPNVGLLREAARTLPIDFFRSFLIGDSPSDIQAGAKMGCATIYLAGGTYDPTPAEHRAENITEAVCWVLARKS